MVDRFSNFIFCEEPLTPDTTPTPQSLACTPTPTPTPTPATGATSSPPASAAAAAAALAGGQEAAATPTPCRDNNLTCDQKEALTRQLRQVRTLARHHGDVMAFFFRNYYMAISVMLLAGVIAAVTLFVITQKGWSDASSYAKTVFLVMTAAVAYYGLFPPVFQQEKNIADNKTLFLEYKTLENEILSYPVTCGNLAQKSDKPEDFITYINAEIDRLSDIAIGFDYGKINYKRAFDLGNDDEEPPPPANGNNANK